MDTGRSKPPRSRSVSMLTRLAKNRSSHEVESDAPGTGTAAG